jgi:uncharacterized membrane protein
MKWLFENKEIITFLLGFAGTIWGFLSPRLPSDILKILKKIGGEGYLQDLIIEAMNQGGTDETRREFVANRIIMIAKGLGLGISKSQANYLVEHGYSTYKKLFNK